MEMITRDIAGVTGEDGAILAAEHVPDAMSAASLTCGAFNLLGRRTNAFNDMAHAGFKPVGQCQHGFLPLASLMMLLGAGTLLGALGGWLARGRREP